MLKKKEGKYDVIFYDNVYPIRFGPYLVDLRTVLPKEHIDMYSSGIASETCTYNDKWVGLPVEVDFNVLYVNEEILKEYNQEVPTTWNELIDTAEYILKEDRKKNPNSDLSAYNGLFDISSGMCSIYEIMYSFRNQKNDPFPDLLSENAIKALEKIKEIKERISSDEEFQSVIPYTINKLMNGRSIFLKYWNNIYSMKYKQHYLPGGKSGISGSCVGGSNIGINLFSSEEKKKGAALFIEYLTSKETQKELMASSNIATGIMELYDDEEVCKIVDCELVKNIQFINRPTHVNKDYDEYSAFFRERVFEYLYGNKTASQVLHEINDYSKIYKISLDEDDNSSLALLFIGILSGLMMIFGLCLILGAGFLEYGDISKFKCQFKWIMVTFGITLNLIPILHKLFVYFPEENKYSTWIKNNRYIFLFIFILIELILDGLSFIKPYEVNFVFNINNGDVNFEISICLDILDSIFLIITETLNINNYIVSFLLNEIIYIMFSLSNYCLIYGYKLFLYFILKNKEDNFLSGSINKLNDSSISYKNKNIQSDSRNSMNTKSKMGITAKIIEYHKKTSINGNVGKQTIITAPTTDSAMVRSSKFDNGYI
ncbi:periplasmic binding protein-like II [Piromyces finnis]|uniref:Periplasmic binding protein-like II n=1 Tax=Piromyces finnis TaxID=1754191 RepID=A0A1Y1VBP7_9FUNG|nr:periplasmic binding protein-like II [Piromyces finnis]|eukprot:ORX51133.1 periplasmic binding protein-like II [Piromyces finnis]